MEPPSHQGPQPQVTVLNRHEPTSEHVGLSDPFDVGTIQRAVYTVFLQHGRPEGEANVLLTGDEEISKLNARFRAIDESTDVLSFPSEDSPFLGDVAISVPYAERQAFARGVALRQELAFLAIHGALHLVGLDDETERERAAMVDEMNRVALLCELEPDPDWASILHGEAQ